MCFLETYLRKLSIHKNALCGINDTDKFERQDSLTHFYKQRFEHFSFKKNKSILPSNGRYG